MPQAVQIVPKFQHPHVETHINDYTQFNDEVSTPVDTNSQFICVFRSSMGIDNVLIKKNDLSDFKKSYGLSNYDKYGQPLMMPLAILSSGSATVHCMRVMPEDAFAANSILCMLYKFDDTTGKMTVKFRSMYVPRSAFSDTSSYSTQKAFKKQISIYAQTLSTTTADGFKQVPIATFRMQGRGIYGNKYRWRIVRNMDYENDYGIKMYSFEVLSAFNGVEKIANYVGSVVVSDKYNNTTLINDVMDDQELGSTVFDVQVFDNYIENVYDEFKTFVESLDESLQDAIPDLDGFDPFFGVGVANNIPNNNIEIINESNGDEDDINVDRPTGVSLMGGDDGSFGPDAKVTIPIVQDDGSIKEEVYTGDQAVFMKEIQMYKDAFNGNLDKKILSSRRVPCTALLDANYPFEVKEALATLANFREDCMCYIDAGINTTFAQIDNIFDQYAVFSTRNISKEIQHYTVKDPTTKKRCEVTTTYFLAQRLPIHYENNGYHIPFVKANAQLSGHIKNTLEPCIDDIDSDVKEKLYVNRFNYYEAIEENIYQRCTQNTAQPINSDLQEENNMMTLFAIKKQLEKDCWLRLYDFTSAEERVRFAEAEMAQFSGWEGSRYDSLNIEFSANEWEAERSIIHCYVSIKFRNMMKRVIIEIDVNKRNFTA